MWQEECTNISNIKQLLADGYEIEVDSPDGFVPVSLYVEKGDYEEYVLRIDGFDDVHCNEHHLFETNDGWKYAKDLINTKSTFVTKNGFMEGYVFKTGNTIPIVDINVNSANHRYYTNDISSHNTNVGKTFGLISLAADYLRNGLNVLYLTLEMREEEILVRMDANLLDIEIDKVRSLGKEEFVSRVTSVASKFNKLKRKSIGKLKVKQYSPGSSHTGHIRNLLKELETRNGFVPDVIMVDYLGIMASEKMKAGGLQPYYILKEIAVELRALAITSNTLIWTAMQLNRNGLNSTDITLTDLSESMGVAHTADFMLGIMRTEELDAQGQLLCKQLKSRYQNKTKKVRFLLGANIDKQQLYDVSDAEQRSIVQAEKIIESRSESSTNNIKARFAALNSLE